MQKWIQKARNKKGFTLVELIVVIAILGILAMLVVPSVTGYIEKAQTNTMEANKQMLAAAAQLYLTDMDLANTPKTTVTVADLVSAGYINKKPTDAEYTITVTAATGEKKQTVTVTSDKDSD